MSDPQVLAQVTFYGHVQGVFFRRRTKAKADELRLTGTVRNLPEGSVEMIAAGPHAAVLQLIDYLKGPEGPGRVDDATINISPAQDFTALPPKFTVL